MNKSILLIFLAAIITAGFSYSFFRVRPIEAKPIDDNPDRIIYHTEN